MRDIHSLPPSRMRKRELRALVTHMRLRHDDEIRELLTLVPREEALAWSMRQARRALGHPAPIPRLSPTAPEPAGQDRYF